MLQTAEVRVVLYCEKKKLKSANTGEVCIVGEYNHPLPKGM